jgi:beta-N-acetylhexosaminidase
VPRWAKDRVAAGLGRFVLFGKDIRSAEQLSELTDRAARPGEHVLLGLDEEGDAAPLPARLDDQDLRKRIDTS